MVTFHQFNIFALTARYRLLESEVILLLNVAYSDCVDKVSQTDAFNSMWVLCNIIMM